jgi:hypothetical protein
VGLSVATEHDPSGVRDDDPSLVVEKGPSVVTAAKPWYRRTGALVALTLAIAAAVAALVFTNGPTDKSTSPTAEVIGPAAKPPGENETIKQYIKDNQITSERVRPGDPGVPTIAIALPQGWSDLGPDTPETAYGAVQWDAAPDPNDPPTIVVLFSKLTGDVDPAKILEYAPGELRNLPDYTAANEPTAGKLGGFDAVQLAGLYNSDGQSRTIAQKTVVIPANDAVYVLQLNADALKTDAAALILATDVIDNQTKITP